MDKMNVVSTPARAACALQPMGQAVLKSTLCKAMAVTEGDSSDGSGKETETFWKGSANLDASENICD